MTIAPRTLLSVCAIFQNEAEYLHEWLEFHRTAGVEKFFLYDNDSTDDWRAVLSPYYNTGIVQVVHWPGPSAQLSAYRHALHEWGLQTRWMAFIDVDEFLFSPTGEQLPVVLGNYWDVGAVGACWAVYGTSYVQRLDGRLVTETLRYRTESESSSRHVKSIVRTERAIDRLPADPHHFHVTGASVDELGRFLNGPFAVCPTYQALRVNHYIARGIDAGTEKMLLPRADNGELRLGSILEDSYNETLDYTIEPWVERMKARL